MMKAKLFFYLAGVYFACSLIACSAIKPNQNPTPATAPDMYKTIMTGINSRGERIHGQLFIDYQEIKGQVGDTFTINQMTFQHYGDRIWGLSGWHPEK